jgi:hypothetical protein
MVGGRLSRLKQTTLPRKISSTSRPFSDKAIFDDVLVRRKKVDENIAMLLVNQPIFNPRLLSTKPAVSEKHVSGPSLAITYNPFTNFVRLPTMIFLPRSS